MASTIPVNLSFDHLQSLTVASRPLLALAEIIWNGLDADAQRVSIRFDRNMLDTIERIRISDDGTGINFDHANAVFGNLGDSWKKGKFRTPSGRNLHGKNGKGRFCGFSLGSLITWNTTAYRQDGTLVTYRIQGSSSALKAFDVSDPLPAGAGARCGTEVIIENLHKEFGSLIYSYAAQEVTKEYANYLTKHPHVVLDYDGTLLDPKTVQDRAEDLPCGELQLSDNRLTRPSLRVIEWKSKVDRTLHLCNEQGASVHEIKLGSAVRAPGLHFTAYLHCDVIQNLDQQHELALDDMNPDVAALVEVAREELKKYFKRREAEDLSKAISWWKEENIYPFEEMTVLTPLEQAERQIFDIVAINVQAHLPEFAETDSASKRFIFRLLAQALRENPVSLQKILGDVLGLKKEALDGMEELLKKTPLPLLVQTSEVVAHRLDFLKNLEPLLSAKDTRKALRGREQLLKLLEKETWLFNEAFTHARSDAKLEKVLQKHLSLLGARKDELTPAEAAEGKVARTDLLLQKIVQTRDGEYACLVVDLKRPSQKLDAHALAQFESYAQAVAADERFHGAKTRWTFLTLALDIDAAIQAPSSPHAEANYTLSAKSWADVLSEARSRLHFLGTQLATDAEHENTKTYLKKAHAKFLPAFAPETAPAEALEADLVAQN